MSNKHDVDWDKIRQVADGKLDSDFIDCDLAFRAFLQLKARRDHIQDQLNCHFGGAHTDIEVRLADFADAESSMLTVEELLTERIEKLEKRVEGNLSALDADEGNIEQNAEKISDLFDLVGELIDHPKLQPEPPKSEKETNMTGTPYPNPHNGSTADIAHVNQGSVTAPEGNKRNPLCPLDGVLKESNGGCTCPEVSGITSRGVEGFTEHIPGCPEYDKPEKTKPVTDDTQDVPKAGELCWYKEGTDEWAMTQVKDHDYGHDRLVEQDEIRELRIAKEALEKIHRAGIAGMALDEARKALDKIGDRVTIERRTE